MKTNNILTISLFAVLSSGVCDAQEYLRMSQKNVVYDVDVIVFSRQLAQPLAESINNASSVKTDDVLTLNMWDRELPLIKHLQTTTNTDSQWEVPLNEIPKQADVLSWVILDKSMNHNIVNRLKANPTIKPLFHQKWRQPASAFLKPQYVELTQLTSNQTDQNQFNLQFNDAKIQDNTIDGQVAFSKQRYTHLHVKMNLYRLNDQGQLIIYKLAQQKRIELGEWQYFDHQQLGVLAKVTAVKLSPNTEP